MLHDSKLRNGSTLDLEASKHPFESHVSSISQLSSDSNNCTQQNIRLTLYN